jgi:hypothetical protein
VIQMFLITLPKPNMVHLNLSEDVKKLGVSVKRRYLQSFRIAAFDRRGSQRSAIERKWLKFYIVGS